MTGLILTPGPKALVSSVIQKLRASCCIWVNPGWAAAKMLLISSNTNCLSFRVMTSLFIKFHTASISVNGPLPPPIFSFIVVDSLFAGSKEKNYVPFSIVLSIAGAYLTFSNYLETIRCGITEAFEM